MCLCAHVHVCPLFRKYEIIDGLSRCIFILKPAPRVGSSSTTYHHIDIFICFPVPSQDRCIYETRLIDYLAQTLILLKKNIETTES